MWFLRLLRLPAVFTAFPDVLAGYVLVSVSFDETPQPVPLVLLLAASALLYLSGMVLNDCFDAPADAELRPERPIPSAQISLKNAMLLGIGLMLAGVACALLAARMVDSRLLVYVAGLLALSIWLYDGLLKLNPIAACAGMALCRLLNMLLGMAAFHDVLFELLAPELRFWAPPLLLASYVAAVTMLSRVEDLPAVEGKDATQARDDRVRIVVTVAGAWLAATLVLLILALRTPNVLAVGLVVALAAFVAPPWRQAMAERTPATIRKAVGRGLMGIILFDAALIAGAWTSQADWILAAALGTVLLLVPAWGLGRLVKLT
jgi:4-hydroxybenzoate polyprenyltransferase